MLRGVDEVRVDRVATQLRGDLLQSDDNWIGTRWSQKLIRLHIEGGEDGGEQTGLYVRADQNSSSSHHTSAQKTLTYTSSVSISLFQRSTISSLYFLTARAVVSQACSRCSGVKNSLREFQYFYQSCSISGQPSTKSN